MLPVLIVTRNPPSGTALALAETLQADGRSVRWAYAEQGPEAMQGLAAETGPAVLVNRLLGDEQPLTEALAGAAALEVALPSESRIWNRTAAVRVTLSKHKQAQCFAAAGLPIPETALVDAGSDLDALDLGWPLVLKPDVGYGGDGLVLAAEPGAASLFGVAQRYLPEASQTLRLVIAAGRLLLAYRRQAPEGSWRANVAAGAHVELHQASATETDLAQRAMQVIGLDIGGVDLVPTAQGPLLIEINPSPGLAGALALDPTIFRRLAQLL